MRLAVYHTVSFPLYRFFYFLNFGVYLFFLIWRRYVHFRCPPGQYIYTYNFKLIYEIPSAKIEKKALGFCAKENPKCISFKTPIICLSAHILLFAFLKNREAFLRFFVALLSGYRRFLVYPTKANPNPARLFNVEDYLDKLERDSRPFAEVMCDTQASFLIFNF